MATFIDNTTNNIETYENGTMICGCAYVVRFPEEYNRDGWLTEEVLEVAFDTLEEAKEYAKDFIDYEIEPMEMVLDQLDGCIYDPASVLTKEE